MKNEQMLKRTDNWDASNDLDLAGILLTISAIAKRLAQLVLDSTKKNGGK